MCEHLVAHLVCVEKNFQITRTENQETSLTSTYNSRYFSRSIDSASLCSQFFILFDWPSGTSESKQIAIKSSVSCFKLVEDRERFPARE